ncbi:MAG TPA: polysaccharide biosynthesis tyrosine autokinase [Puia sp.]|jgi:tyrosine-protein kinase Etk/Wzc|nr:polysaccharide biosynthesis tyrosine autokinase [Puia sp.]
MSEENLEIPVKKKGTGISPRELILKYLHYLPWVIVSVVLLMVAAYLKIRYTTPMFSISGKMLVKSDNPYFEGNEKFDEIFSAQSKNYNTLNDEMEVIRSRSMAARVVKALDLQMEYFNKGKIRTTAIHKDAIPFSFSVLMLKDSLRPFGILLTIQDRRHFRVDQRTRQYNFGDTVDLPEAICLIRYDSSNINTFGTQEFIVDYTPLEARSAELSSQIKVAQLGDNENVILLAIQNENPRIGLDIVNQYMTEYQQSTLEDKRQIAVNTANFIDDQLGLVKTDLGNAERNLQGFREKNKVFAPEEQSKMAFSALQESSTQLAALDVKVRVLDTLARYISDASNSYRVVPATMGIEEPSLIQQVGDYNRIVLQREVDLRTTPETNPLIRSYETAIEKLRTNILVNLNNIRKSYEVAVQSIQGNNKTVDNLISKIPSTEKELLEVTRQQKILEELYSFLLQKKLETAISAAAKVSNIKVLEPAMSSSQPVSPSKKSVYSLFLFLGLAIPTGIIVLIEYLNDKVKTKTDIETSTETPILGEIGHVGGGDALVVTKNNRQFIAEQFRAIRSNLQYILPKVNNPVIMVTSTISGEGKSFLSTNLGAVLAISGKKTVVLEFDIRKPKLMEGLGLRERLGITNFIVGNFSVDNIIYPVPDQNDLYVIPCGPIPPNPAEMLLDEKVTRLFAELKTMFDAIIIDTAPVGLVSDAIIIGAHANCCMYVVRHNYTLKKQIQLIDDLYTQKKLPRLAIIINDIHFAGAYNYYGYGYGYYGHGYGKGYFEGGQAKKKGLWAWFKSLFS